jgi:hypothetical protein
MMINVGFKHRFLMRLAPNYHSRQIKIIGKTFTFIGGAFLSNQYRTKEDVKTEQMGANKVMRRRMDVFAGIIEDRAKQVLL